jgi:hypothetical protein
MHRAIFADRQQAICQTTRPFTTHAIEVLAHGFRDSNGHTLSSDARELLGQSVCFLAFDVQAHGAAPTLSPMQRKEASQRCAQGATQELAHSYSASAYPSFDATHEPPDQRPAGTAASSIRPQTL